MQPTGPNDSTAAGEWIVSLCSKKIGIGETRQILSPLEQTKFDEFFTLHLTCPTFKTYHIEALRRCLVKELKPDYRLARKVLSKDDTRLLLVNESNVLQAAIQAVKVDPGLLGQCPEESCPELLGMVKLLVAHGASTNCLDSHGNSALVHACVLGHEGLFCFLIDNGAQLSTTHPRHDPHQSDDNLEQSFSPSLEKVNLLQITLDAIISPQRIVDMTLVGWPPGVDYDTPLWKLNLESTWGGIVLRLLQADLPYTRDDPGLIMILHIACYQGALEIVRQLLGFGVVTDVAGPRMVVGQGLGASFGSAMHAAAARCQLVIVKLLMAHGENLRIRRPCISRSWRDTRDMTPVEVAIALDDNSESLLIFLDALTQFAEGLGESDHDRIISFAAKGNHTDFTRRLLERGILPREMPVHLGSLEMAQLFVSYGFSPDAAAVQKSALNRGQLDLLRWSVDQYGPLLPSDAVSWGKIANRLLGFGQRLDMVQYLVAEYPGLHIDAVLQAQRSVFGQEQEPTPTSWLRLAVTHDNNNALRLLLAEGADPGCPGLALDALEAIRQGHQSFRNIRERLEMIYLLQSINTAWSPPSYAELKRRQAKTISNQKHAWDARVQELMVSRQEVPRAQPQQGTLSGIRFTPILSHQPLRGQSAFRLLELSPSSNRTDPLTGRLIESDVTFQPDYEALSYVWGEHCLRKSITLDDQVVPITPNLHSALTHLRYDSCIRTLWVDAICIDQVMHAERNQQVSIMGDVYRSARQVIVWLGEAADDSHLVFEHLRDDTNKEAFPNYPTPSTRKRQAWNSLVTRPWFFRTWVIQEVALSRKAIVVCGNDEAPWMDLGGASGDISSGARGLSTVLSAPGDDPDHPLSGFDADIHAWRLRMLGPGSDAVKILRYSRMCQTSEVRDKVYGILGLFEPGFITVDYGLSVEQIFRHFTEAVIRAKGDLRILTFLGDELHSDTLPSWVPDFASVATTAGSLPHHYWHPRYDQADYALRMPDGTAITLRPDELVAKMLPGLSFPESGTLVVNGKMVDRIHVMAPELVADPSHAPGTDGFAHVMRAWESLATRFIPASSVAKAFGATLAASHGSEIHSIDVGFTQWYRHCGTGVLEAADSAMYLRDIEFYLWWLSAGDDTATDGKDINVDWELGEFTKQMELASYGCRLFVTEKGAMGMAGPRSRVGDCIAFLPGADEPFVLRRRHIERGWMMVGNGYLHGLDPYTLFQDDECPVEGFVIY